MKKLIGIVLLLVVILATFVSCGADEKASNFDSGSKVDSADIETDVLGSSNRKLIYTLNINAETINYKEYMNSLNEKIKEYNGYFEKFNESGSNLKVATIVIRIPVEKYEDMKNTLYNNASVTYYDQNVDDVTSKYINIQSRISALETEKQALESMLENAGTVYEVMEIRSKLAEVIYELENYQRQLLNYDDLISYCTINLRVYEIEEYLEPVKDGAFTRIGKNFVKSLKFVGTAFVEIFIFIIGYLPILIIIGVVIFVIVFISTKKKKK